MERSDVWCVGVGSANYPGEKIVQDITSFAKRWKYLHENCKGCIGKWLVLRVSASSDKTVGGTAWCAVELGPPETDLRARQEQYGWEDGRNYAAFPILKVRLFNLMHVEQWGQGIPFRLVICSETTEIIRRIEKGTSREALLVMKKAHREKVMQGRPTAQARAQYAKEKREAKHRVKDVAGVFLSPRRTQSFHQLSPHLCCSQRQCSRERGCVPDDVSGLVALIWYRSELRKLSQEGRRYRIAELVDVDAAKGEKNTYFFTREEVQDMYVTQTARRGLGRPFTEADRVCHDFFHFATGTSKQMLRQPSLDESVRQSRFQADLTRARPRPALGAEGVVRWLIALADFYLFDPTREIIQLPFATRKAVHDLYKSDWEEYERKGKAFDRQWTQQTFPFLGQKYVELQYFYNIWGSDPRVKHIIIRKHLRFSLCPVCVEFIETRAHTLPRDELAVLKAKEHAHCNFIRKERGSYYTRAGLGRAHPSDFLSVIIDGADQAAFGSPHFCTHSKETEHCWRIATSLMGALVHGFGVFGFTYMPNIKHGANLVIEVLHRVLDTVWKEGLNTYLPDVLFLQVDNTTKQNKNKYLFGYLALLVEWNCFETVIVSFLMVGHTHEDIDQIFSRVATYLRKHNAVSRAEFLEAFAASYKARRHEEDSRKFTANIEQAANMSDLFDNLNILNPMGSSEKRDGITKFHQFKFVKEAGVVVMYVREWCAETPEKEPWRGIDIDEFGRPLMQVVGRKEKYVPHVMFRPEADIRPEVILTSIPPSQRKDWNTHKFMKTGKDGIAYNKYFRKTREGVETYIRTRGISEVHAKDLRYCLDLLESKEDKCAEWETAMYEKHVSRDSRHIPHPSTQLLVMYGTCICSSVLVCSKIEHLWMAYFWVMPTQACEEACRSCPRTMV